MEAAAEVAAVAVAVLVVAAVVVPGEDSSVAMQQRLYVH